MVDSELGPVSEFVESATELEAATVIAIALGAEVGQVAVEVVLEVVDVGEVVVVVSGDVVDVDVVVVDVS